MILILFVLAFICFGVQFVRSKGNDFIALGLALWVLTEFIGKLPLR
jgi:hypothetical protein